MNRALSLLNTLIEYIGYDEDFTLKDVQDLTYGRATLKKLIDLGLVEGSSNYKKGTAKTYRVTITGLNYNYGDYDR